MGEITLVFGLSLGTIAFFAEYIDSTLGMGYGTLLTPLLLLFGFSPFEVVPAVLASEAVTGITAGIMHHFFGNVQFDIKPKERYSGGSILTQVRTRLSKDLKITLLIASCSIIGTVSAVFLATSMKPSWLNLYIAVLILTIGVFILLTARKQFSFSWKKIALLGIVASFNKGMSGGGYGPLVTGGQLLSGVDNKSAIGITSFAEGLTCVVGFLLYFAIKKNMDIRLFPYIIIGALLSVPLSTFTVKKIASLKLRSVIGIITVSIGAFSLIRLIVK